MREKRIAQLAALLALAAFLCLMVFSHRQILIPDRTMSEFDAGWSYSWEGAGGSADMPLDLDVPENEVLTLKNTLPENILSGSGMVFRSKMQRVWVYVEGKLIYQFPQKRLIGNAVPSTWNFIRLGARDAGKDIVICLESPYASFSGRLDQVWIGNYNELILHTILKVLPVFLLSVLPLLLGIVIFLLSVLYRRYHLYDYQRMQGLLLIFLSLWLCGESRMVFGFIGTDAQHYITLFSLFLCPFFLVAYLRARWENICGGLTQKLFYLCGACVPAAAVLEVTGLCSIVELIPFFHMLAAVSLSCTAYIYIQAAKWEKKHYSRSELACVMLIVAAGVAELVNFYMTGGMVGVYIRAAILIYALNLLRICAGMLFREIMENRKLERQLRYSRAELMSSQIKPHFIYNTLNSIRTLIKTDPDTAYGLVYDFSTYLRANLDSVGGRETIPFSEELKHVRAYLNIEKIRFEDRLDTVFSIETTTFAVPPLSIQPLVENAVKHGVCKRVEGGTVWIRSRESEEDWIVEVEDDGVGFEWNGQNVEQKEDWEIFSASGEEAEGLAESSHIGIRNIRFRIGVLTGGKLDIQSSPGKGTKVTVYFPKRR